MASNALLPPLLEDTDSKELWTTAEGARGLHETEMGMRQKKKSAAEKKKKQLSHTVVGKADANHWVREKKWQLTHAQTEQ